MLLQIRNYIQKSGMASTQQLMREFHLDADALQPMLDLWVHKGVIKPCKFKKVTACQSRCFRCKPNSPVFYEMAEKAIKQI